MTDPLDRLRDKDLLRAASLINGRWIEGGGERLSVEDPATGACIDTVGTLTRAEAVTAVEAARDAQAAWAALSAGERATLLRAWYTAIIEACDDIATLITAEMGKPIREAEAEVKYAASFVEWYAEEARRAFGEVLPSAFQNSAMLALRQPAGVAAAITPWNFPAAMITRKVAPALAAGCSVVARPASKTPLTAIALAELAYRAGIPAGVFNLLIGSSSDIGPVLTGHEAIAVVTFTGSTEVGRTLMEQAARSMKRVSLELGGDAPFVVFPDADPENAAREIVRAKFRASGQTCICANRIIVHKAVAEDLVGALEAAIRDLKVGNGFDDGVDIGPLIDAGAAQRVEDLSQSLIAAGGTCIVGGVRREDVGPAFFAPTLIDHVPNAAVAGTEIFGPVTPVIRVSDEDELIRVANETPYGLAAYAYARDVARVHRAIRDLHFGMVGVNQGLISHTSAPFGGVKQSGIGREGGHWGLEEFLNVKYAVIGGL